MAATRNQHGLTAKQDRFAVLVAQGMKQGDAYRQAYNSISMSDQQVATEASRLRRHPKVSRRIGEILEAAHIGDVDTAQRAFNDLLAALEQAELDPKLDRLFLPHAPALAVPRAIEGPPDHVPNGHGPRAHD